jgi:hypothetical protein
MGTDASYQVYSDASDCGYGGYLAENGKVAKRLVQGFWLPEERGASINTRELWAAERVLAAYGKWKNLQGVTIQLFVDNQVAVSYLRKMGGRFGHLRDIVERIWQRCEERNITLAVEFLEGEKNVLADRLSRIELNTAEWQLNREVFKELDCLWGPHSVDYFASRTNTLLPRFASWNVDERATYIDGLRHLKARENGFAHPPVAIIHKVLQGLYMSSRDLTLVVPAWPSQVWWPMILHMMIEVPVLLPDRVDLLSPVHGPVGLDRLPWRLLCFRISGNSSKRRVFRRSYAGSIG